MNQYDTPYFPVEFLLNYVKNEKINGLKRMQTYVAFRFLKALEKEHFEVLEELSCHCNEEILKEAGWESLQAFLEEDLYFSPSFTENTFEPVLLLFAMEIIEEKDGAMALYMDKLLSKYCPQALRMNYDDAAFALDMAFENELFYWAALYVSVTNYQSALEDILPEFARIYWNDLHFTCGDFLLYDFLNQYFETSDVLHDERYEELCKALVTATLQSFKTDAEGMATDVMLQLKSPSSYFAGLYQVGAVAIRDMPTVEVAGMRMEKLLAYAAAYELRNNLYDYHLDEDKTITFDNWKSDLKWYYTQYSNVYNMAVMTYYASEVSKQLLKKQWKENVNIVVQLRQQEKQHK